MNGREKTIRHFRNEETGPSLLSQGLLGLLLRTNWPIADQRVPSSSLRKTPIRLQFAPFSFLKWRMAGKRKTKACGLFNACLHEGGRSRLGEVTFGGSLHPSSKHDQIKMRDYMDTRVTSPTWGPPPSCK